MSTNTLPERFLMITPTGIQAVRLTVDQCGGAEEHLRLLANDTPTVTPRLFSCPTGPVHVAVTQQWVTLFTAIPKFNLTTFYTTVTAGRTATLKPMFTEGRTHVRMSPEWTPPANMRLWFIAILPFVNGTPRYARSNLVMTCTDPGVGGVFRVPLPNVFPDGKLCLGSETNVINTVHPSEATPLDKVFSNALNIFHSSPWNADLLHEHSEVARNSLFTFDAATNKPVMPQPLNWPTFLNKISKADFNSLPLTNPNFFQS